MEKTQNASVDSQNINRREIIKVLAASGGALAAAAFLPGKWTRPAVGSGVLPAHAQATCGSATPTITRAVGLIIFDQPIYITVQMYFQDPENIVSDDDLIAYSVDSPCGSTQGTRSFASTDWAQGQANFNISPFNCNEGELCLRIIANGCTSNQYCTELGRQPIH